MLLDSNILIYAANASGLENKVSHLVEDRASCISAISKVEVLGYHNFKANEKTALEGILDGITIFPVSEQVIDVAVELRQRKSMSLGDAIIAATALQYQLPLVTRNTDDFKWIAGLQLVNPFA